jgi:hypothetical protein
MRIFDTVCFFFVAPDSVGLFRIVYKIRDVFVNRDKDGFVSGSLEEAMPLNSLYIMSYFFDPLNALQR